jgi:hypothetical protein
MPHKSHFAQTLWHPQERGVFETGFAARPFGSLLTAPKNNKGAAKAAPIDLTAAKTA